MTGWRHMCPVAGDSRTAPVGDRCPMCGTTQTQNEARTNDDRLAAALWWRIRARAGERWIDQPAHVRIFWRAHAAGIVETMRRHGLRVVRDETSRVPAVQPDVPATPRSASDEAQERAFDAMNAARDEFHASPSEARRISWRMQAATYLREAGVPPSDAAQSIRKIEDECRAVLASQARKEAAE